MKLLDVLDTRSQAGERSFGSENNDDFRDARSFLRGQLRTSDHHTFCPVRAWRICSIISLLALSLCSLTTSRTASQIVSVVIEPLLLASSRSDSTASRLLTDRQPGSDEPLLVCSPYDPSLQLDRIDVASAELKSGSRKKYVDVSAISFNLTILGCALAHFGYAG